MLGASKLTKYIKCEGCRKFATELYGQAQALLSEHKGRKKMGEEPVLEMLEAPEREKSASASADDDS